MPGVLIGNTSLVLPRTWLTTEVLQLATCITLLQHSPEEAEVTHLMDTSSVLRQSQKTPALRTGSSLQR